MAGEYTRHGGKLTSTTTPTTLLLVHRGTTTQAKAHTYVLRVLDDGRRQYVSSLWDGPAPGTYALEYKGIRYAVTLTDADAEIGPVQGGTEYSSVPPVAKSATIPDSSRTALDPAS